MKQWWRAVTHFVTHEITLFVTHTGNEVGNSVLFELFSGVVLLPKDGHGGCDDKIRSKVDQRGG